MGGALGGLGGSSTAGGGVMPGQQALAQYTLGENLVKNAGAFSEAPMSTMKTMSDAGAYMGEAQQLQQMSQADANANQAFQNQNKANMSSAIGGLGTTLGGLGG